jgi:formylglycine-generating enzyme required for sulfatase activity
MLVIPPGSFVMGSPVTEAGRIEEEGPQHSVAFARRFTVSRAPITRAEYEKFVRATKRDGRLDARAWAGTANGATIPP